MTAMLIGVFLFVCLLSGRLVSYVPRNDRLQNSFNLGLCCRKVEATLGDISSCAPDSAPKLDRAECLIYRGNNLLYRRRWRYEYRTFSMLEVSRHIPKISADNRAT